MPGELGGLVPTALGHAAVGLGGLEHGDLVRHTILPGQLSGRQEPVTAHQGDGPGVGVSIGAERRLYALVLDHLLRIINDGRPATILDDNCIGMPGAFQQEGSDRRGLDIKHPVEDIRPEGELVREDETVTGDFRRGVRQPAAREQGLQHGAGLLVGPGESCPVLAFHVERAAFRLGRRYRGLDLCGRDLAGKTGLPVRFHAVPGWSRAALAVIGQYVLAPGHHLRQRPPEA